MDFMHSFELCVLVDLQEARTNPSDHLKVLLISRILQFQSSQRREVARKEVRTNPSDLVKFWPTTVETSLVSLQT